MSELLPTLQAADVRQGLVDYLATTFALADPEAQASLNRFLQHPRDGIFRGPYVRIRLPFRAAGPGWEQVLDWRPPLPPYGHQAAAFARLSSAGERGRPLPTLITTGTGSGKTEAFLFPILDHVLRAKRAGEDGIKALILYPMNALANDQARRLAALITGDPALAGVRAALYTGQSGPERSTVTADGLITSRNAICDEAPDILLTNYKMLDQLLLRPGDQDLWKVSAFSLRYLVLDEFHTYDGAQGTDVAMLLRRLGLALRRHQPDEHPDLDDAARARPLGLVTPVATSATLGDGGDPAAMLDFARAVFGEALESDAVVGETRLTLDEWAGNAEQRMREQGLAPVPLDTALTDAVLDGVRSLGDERRSAPLLTAMVLTRLYDDRRERLAAAATSEEPSPEERDLLLDAVKGHPFVRDLVDAGASARSLEDLALAVTPAEVVPAELVEQRDRDRIELVAVILAALSHVRTLAGRAAPSIDLHLWVRSLTRIDRVAQPVPQFRWADDGEVVAADAVTEAPAAAFPAIYCRHCGRSGWGVEVGPVGSSLALDDESIRRNHAARPTKDRFRPLIAAPREGRQALEGQREERPAGLRWFRVGERELVADPPSDETDPERSVVLPVLTHTGDDADDAAREDTCPSCDRVDGVRFLGSAVATQLSVAVTTMFGDRHLDAAEKKALVFTDSVQDAAHRAGFVQSRAHVFNFRNAARSAVRGTMSLHEVAEAMLADATTPERRFRLMPPDLVDRAGFRPFWDPASGQQPSVAVRNRVRARVQFDLALEFGLQSRVGRTLELTGSVAASVDAGPASALEAIGRAAIEGFEVAGRLDEGGDPVAGPALVSWVRGTLERMRERGSIAHPWLRPYLDHNGERWYVWGGRPRNQGMPAFPKDREAPAFPRVGAHAAGGRPSLLDHATSSQGWYARWATRFFDVPAADGARLARRLFEQLAKAGVIVPHPIAGSEAVAYTIEPDRILLAAIADDDLAAGRTSLVCDTCESPVPGSIDTVDQLTDGPCMVANCKGRLRRRGGEPGNYYRQQYDEGEMRRVVAREHTSLLDDATRLSYETAFKSAADRPDAPNVLVATPTLEMGIDIGDLSTVFLAGLPRTVASYVQRVGRAGRLTGNALAMAFVLGRGDQLPKLGDPLATIEGAVRPPATYLNAVEILRRQYVAFLIDTMSAEGRSGQVAQARDVLRRTEGTSVLATLIREGEEHAEERLATFLGTFDELATAAADSLRAWATPQAEQRGTSGLALAAIDAAARWNRDVETLRLRRSAIEDSLDALKSAAEAPTATSDDGVAYRAARASAAMVRRQLETLRGEHWVAALERFGLLPNYTLLDDHAQLDVAVSWIDPDSQEYVAEDRSYERGRSIAIQELAPGATFYAQGLEIAIDAVDLGRDGAALRRMTFCPSCGFAADAGPAPIPACPRCGEKAIADTNQTMPVVELEQVSAEVRRDESSISDRVDERTRTRFLVQLAPDFDPARLVDARFVAETGFGFRAYTDLELRWVNLGRVGGGAPRAIAGSGDVLAPLFRVCSGCGKLDSHGNANSPREHRAWCRYRAAREEHVETIALTRTLRTQGLLLRLPTWLTIGSTLTRLSFAAGLQLGLGALIGGDPDHLRFAFVAEPAPDDEANPTGLLIHDAVPGGTGYLADLADLGRLRRVLELAHERLADCACAAEGRSACDRCLLPYAPNGSADAVSRVSALQSIERLLRLDEGGAWTESREDPGPLDPESHLEQWFRAVFRERVEALGAAVQEEPGEWGERLVITLPGQGRRWTLRPQVLAGPARPDFVLEASGSPVAPVAIFTDGFAYHASVAHNRLADDAEKRRALRELGYRVVAVTWRDLQDAKAGAAAGADGWYDAATAETWVDPFGLSPAALDLVTEDPLALLVRHLQDPLTTEERWERVADALPFLTFTRSVADAAGGALAGRAAALAAGSAAPGGDGGWALVRPHLAMVTRRAATGGTHTETALVLDDRPEAVSQPDFADAWRLWLRLSVLLGARSERRAVMATVEGVGATASEPVPATIVGPIDLALSEDWSAVLDVAYGEERDLLLALSAVPGMVVPDVGLEVGDGIPVGVAWLDRRIAVDLGLEDRDRQDLERGGWRLVSPTPEAALAALNGA